MLDATDFLLVNRWQRGFPLTPQPFDALARDAGIEAAEALARLQRLQRERVIDRIGPVFRPNTVGASLLAAMAVPPASLEQVAGIVNGHAGVNHNYQREHRYNLWFVATAATTSGLEGMLASIEAAAGLPLLRLPLLEEYHIDLGFDLGSREVPRGAGFACTAAPLTETERRVVAATSGGLPLLPRPWEALGSQLGLAPSRVVEILARLLADGRIRRIGTVVRHRRVGYRANAMAVWDLPDAEAAHVGRALAADAAVTLCYRRTRAQPEWPYNLYCMVHGRERGQVEQELARLQRTPGLVGRAHAVLFSTRCFVQRAANYG